LIFDQVYRVYFVCISVSPNTTPTTVPCTQTSDFTYLYLLK